MARHLWILTLGIIALAGCQSPKSRIELGFRPVGTPVKIPAPLGLPDVPIPADNPPTTETIALGKALFFSPLLSVDKSVSCSSCHNPAKGFADGRRVSPGVGAKTGKRNAPSVINAAYYTLQFWDGRADRLESQASGPMMNPVEMAHTVEGVEQRCSEDAGLRKMFEEAFGPAPDGGSPVSLKRATYAIAAYERTLLRGNSPFDRFQYGGDSSALSPAAKRGLKLFRDPKGANCAICHTIEEKYALFTDNTFHNLGVGLTPEGELSDAGRFTVTASGKDQGAFKTPSLRNIAETAPYMHDGSLAGLKEVIDFYVGGGSSNPHLDKEVKPLSHLSKQDRADLVAFLQSLTGEAAP